MAVGFSSTISAPWLVTTPHPFQTSRQNAAGSSTGHRQSRATASGPVKPWRAAMPAICVAAARSGEGCHSSSPITASFLVRRGPGAGVSAATFPGTDGSEGPSASSRASFRPQEPPEDAVRLLDVGADGGARGRAVAVGERVANRLVLAVGGPPATRAEQADVRADLQPQVLDDPQQHA